jgi:lysophospholipase L1-like esterase
MKSFRSNYQTKKSALTIDYSQAVFLIGSCFSNNIAAYLTYRKFKVLSNPYGILFNPISIFQSLEEIIQLKEYKEEELIAHNELQHSLAHHSDFSGLDKQEVINNINQNIVEAHQFLKNTSYLFITLGTAWVYKYNGSIVANCHKIPNHQFGKVLLSVAEIQEAFPKFLKQLREFNPKINIVFTLSPVRHLKDGFEENNLSKSILRTAIHEIQKVDAEIAYFPSYEIMLDDLRDYRFYESDMLHPNKDAINYIWEKFKESYIKESDWTIMARIENLQAAMLHRPRFENTEAHRKHLEFIEKEKLYLAAFFE